MFEPEDRIIAKETFDCPDGHIREGSVFTYVGLVDSGKHRIHCDFTKWFLTDDEIAKFKSYVPDVVLPDRKTYLAQRDVAYTILNSLEEELERYPKHVKQVGLESAIRIVQELLDQQKEYYNEQA